MRTSIPLLSLLILAITTLGSFARGEDVTIAPEKMVIVTPGKTEDAKAAELAASAAQELAKHLRLITGAEVGIVAGDSVGAGRYPFYVGIAPPGEVRPFAPEEARWAVKADATYLYGEANNGALFAVYGFLEETLGVRWIGPGERGTAFTRQSPLTLRSGESSWAPGLLLRKLRVDARPGIYPQKKESVADFWDFMRTPAAHDQYANDERAWQLRMRMGAHAEINYGHAFTNWWRMYGQTHPEYFALKQDGKREPEQMKSDKPIYTADNPRGFQNIKLCPSNPEVARQIVRNWVAAGRRTKWINVCENDSPPVNFCTCAECTKLDVEKPGEKPGDHLTDRYIHLANAVAREARLLDPEAGAVIYAYNETEQPPRRERVDENVLIAVVPTTADLTALDALLGGWHAAGARQMLIRPNLLLYYASTVMPMGFEKQMFDVFQVAYRNGAVAADYDALTGFWSSCGLGYYVLAKSLSEPSRTFDYWLDHYCAAYGPAAAEARAYFTFWRTELWEKRLQPDMDKIITTGRYFNFARGLMWSLDRYYTPADFDRAEALLQPALQKDLTAAQKDRVRELVLTTQQARLTYQAVCAKGAEKFEYSRALLAFRHEHQDDLTSSWLGVFGNEAHFGDLAGLKTAERLKEYPLPWLATALAWRFKIDPKDLGLAEKWWQLPWSEMKTWELLRTDAPWENPYTGDSTPSPALRAQLKNYDGIGWYATSERTPVQFRGRQVYLYFGGVDESCWVYVNGRLAGQHLFAKPDDWNTPFEIRIDPFIDWQQPEQTITVRVEDKGGAGGIWKTVWMVSRK